MYTNDKIYTTERMTGGIKRFKMLYDGLVKMGYDVTLFCGESKEVLDKYNKNAFSINRNIKKKRFFNGINIYFNNRKLIKNLKKENYDEVIVFDVPTAIGLCLKKIKNINLFLRQDLIEYRKIVLFENRKNVLYRLIYLTFMSICEFICCKRSRRIIVQCNYDLDNLINRHKFIRKLIAKKSYVQINNVNAPWIIEKSTKTKVEKIKNPDLFSICFIGDFSNTRKGHDVLLPALKRIIDEQYKIKCHIIGDGQLLSQVKKEYTDFNNIVFHGRMSNPLEIVKSSNLVIVPSRADSCPNTVLESLYNDVLVIGSNRGGIPEILDNEKLLFELNINSIVSKVKTLIDNRELYNELKKIEENRKKELSFDWTKKIANIMEATND